jgi:N-acetylglucosamine kinase-like BadF-type ATPase
MLRAIGVASVVELTKAVYTSDDPRAFIASLAPVVAAAADGGDRKAETILDWAATELAELVARTVDLIDRSEYPIPLAIGGGLVLSSQRLQQQLREWLHRFDVECEMVLVDDPLEGCVRLAHRQFEGTLVNWHKI